MERPVGGTEDCDRDLAELESLVFQITVSYRENSKDVVRANIRGEMYAVGMASYFRCGKQLIGTSREVLSVALCVPSVGS